MRRKKSDVKSVFDNLKTDLNLDDSIPIVVGELLYEEAGGVAASMNQRVNQLASEYPCCKVASAEKTGKRVLQQFKKKITIHSQL